MSFVSNLSILYDVDIINDSYILLSNDKIETYNHIPKELKDLYLENPNILGHICGKILLDEREINDEQFE